MQLPVCSMNREELAKAQNYCKGYFPSRNNQQSEKEISPDLIPHHRGALFFKVGNIKE